MGTTTRYALPYPDPNSSVDVPRDVKALAEKIDTGVVGIASTDTATVDFSGNGTVATPLTAVVKPGSVLSAVADTTEIDLTNTAGTVSAALKGVRNGNWTMSAGSVVVGDKASNNSYGFFAYRGVSPSPMTAQLGISGNYGTGGAAALMMSTDDGVTGALYINKAGEIGSSFNGVNRYIPFATFAAIKPLTLTSVANATITFTFPVNRFTIAPAGVGQVHNNTANYFCYSTSLPTVTGMSLGARHYDNTAASVTVSVSAMAIQLTPFGAGIDPGLVAAEIPGEHIVTCHSSGCENEGVQIPITVDGLAVCGACLQDIDDITNR